MDLPAGWKAFPRRQSVVFLPHWKNLNPETEAQAAVEAAVAAAEEAAAVKVQVFQAVPVRSNANGPEST